MGFNGSLRESSIYPYVNIELARSVSRLRVVEVSILRKALTTGAGDILRTSAAKIVFIWNM